jgi:hypothetical protein
VYLVYADDSDSSGDNLADKQAPVQVLCSFVMNDAMFRASETILGAFLRWQVTLSI